MRELRHRVVVITGAAGGIGQALALAFARRGCRLGLVDIDGVGLERVREAVAEIGAPASVHTADVRDRESLEQVRDDVLEEHGSVNVLINNAGVTAFALFEHLDPAELERIVAINFWGVVHGCQVFLPALRAADRAHVVNMASMAAFAGIPFQSIYCASKFAVRGFTESLRIELSLSNIGVTCVMPGTTRSRILAAAPSRDPRLVEQMSSLLLRHGGSPDKLALRVVRGVRWNQAEVRGAIDSILLDLAKRTAPWLLRVVFGRLVRAAARRGLLGAPPVDLAGPR